MRKFFSVFHRVLGLSTGLVVFIVAVTGCCWVFKDEFETDFGGQYLDNEESVMLYVSEVEAIASALHPGKNVHGVLYRSPTNPIEIIYYHPDPFFYKSAFIHPVSGQKLAEKDHFSGFFAIVLFGHLSVWLPPAIGSYVVKWSVFIFLFMLISGLVLWWPKNKRARKQRLRLDWKKTTRWRRKNYDLHTVLGFYGLSLAFVLGFTGCIMAFGWFKSATYTALGGSKNTEFYIPTHPAGESAALATKSIDQLIPQMQQAYPEANSFELHFPQTDSSAIYVEVNYSAGCYYNNDYRFYDQNTLEEISVDGIYGTYDQTTVPDKIMRMNYDIHVGAIGGIPGKILAFLISFLIAGMPVTGFLIWYGRRNKKKKKAGSKRGTTAP